MGMLLEPVSTNKQKGVQAKKKEEKGGIAQGLLQQLVDDYELTDTQKGTKQFQASCARWGRDVRQWQYFLRSLSPRDYLINKVVKFDLKYFKDADVDTIIPTAWHQFAYDKTIARYFTYSRTRRHGMEKLEEVFKKLPVASYQMPDAQGDAYGVEIHYK
jgi:hypothetical protein